MGEFLRTLNHSKFATFIVTKAHRDTDIAGHADIEHFRFDGAGVDLSLYDEILLFGLAPAPDALSPMSDAELAALATFMDGGGGVFATGDHEDLGVVLCGRASAGAVDAQGVVLAGSGAERRAGRAASSGPRSDRDDSARRRRKLHQFR